MGMGGSPARGRTFRTVLTNFPAALEPEDSVFLCSPETATSALKGVITDPRDLGIDYPAIPLAEPGKPKSVFVRPLPPAQARKSQIVRGDNIAPLPIIEPLADRFTLSVALKLGDNISTDDICPAGARAMPFRSNVQKISQFCFDPVDANYVERVGTMPLGHIIAAGDNMVRIEPGTCGLRLAISGYGWCWPRALPAYISRTSSMPAFSPSPSKSLQTTTESLRTIFSLSKASILTCSTDT